MNYPAWQLKKADPAAETSLAGAGCGVLLRRVLAARGCTDPAAAQALLGQGEPLSDPFLLTDMDKAVVRIQEAIIRHAALVHGDIAVAAVEKEIDRVTAAKAADELLTLSGIHASFVLFKNGTGVNLSARSLGEINVQFIMEKLGGGGNSTTAGGQVADASVDEVRARLLNAIDEYMEE